MGRQFAVPADNGGTLSAEKADLLFPVCAAVSLFLHQYRALGPRCLGVLQVQHGVRFGGREGGVDGGASVTRKLVAVGTLVCSRPFAANVAIANDISGTFNLSLDVEVDLELVNATWWNVDGGPARGTRERTHPLLFTDKLLETAESKGACMVGSLLTVTLMFVYQ